MKTIKLMMMTLMMCFLGASFSQTDTTGFTIQLSKIVELDSSFTAQKTTSSFLNWVALNFKSANNVIQLKDVENSNVILKFILSSSPMSMGVPADGSTHCTLSFKAVGNRYKIEFSQIYFKYRLNEYIVTYEEYKTAYLDGKAGKKTAINYILSLNGELIAIYNSITSALNVKSDGF